MRDILNRFRSPVVLTGIGAVILWALKTSGKLEGMGLTADSFNTGWNLVTGLLVAIGFVNNPTDKGNF